MKAAWLRRMVMILAVASLLMGCDETPLVLPDGREGADVRLGVGYSTSITKGGDTFVISFDVLGEPNTTYEVRIDGAGSKPGESVQLTTNERGIGVGGETVAEAGFYDVVVSDPEGNVVAVETLEVE